MLCSYFTAIQWNSSTVQSLHYNTVKKKCCEVTSLQYSETVVLCSHSTTIQWKRSAVQLLHCNTVKQLSAVILYSCTSANTPADKSISAIWRKIDPQIQNEPRTQLNKIFRKSKYADLRGVSSFYSCPVLSSLSLDTFPFSCYIKRTLIKLGILQMINFKRY